MGVCANGNVNIYFETQRDAMKVHEILTANMEKGRGWNNPEESFKKYLGEEEGTGHYSFYNFSDNGSREVYFELESGRVQNAEWQIEQVIKLLKVLVKDKVIEGVAEFSSSLMMDAGGWYLEADEFDPEEEGGQDE